MPFTSPHMASTDTLVCGGEEWPHYCWVVAKVLTPHSATSDITLAWKGSAWFLQGGDGSTGSLHGLQ